MFLLRNFLFVISLVVLHLTLLSGNSNPQKKNGYYYYAPKAIQFQHVIYKYMKASQTKQIHIHLSPLTAQPSLGKPTILLFS